MNIKLINLIVKAIILLVFIRYTFNTEKIMKGDMLTIISVIIIGYYLIKILTKLNEELNEVNEVVENKIDDVNNFIDEEINNIDENISNIVENNANDIINDTEIVLNEIAPSASEQMAPHKDNQMKQLNPAKITNDVTIQNLNNENVQSLEDTVKDITESTNGQCQIGQQIDSATGKCVAITVKTDDNNAVAINVVPTTPDLNLDVTDNTDGKLTAQETVDLLEEDAKKKQIKCEQIGMIVDKETGECIGLTKKTGEYINVKRSPQVENKEVTYKVVCSNNDISKCKWEKVGKLVPKRSMTQHGYSFVQPHEWNIPRKRTPVCNPQKDCPICPLYINKNTEDLLTVQNIHEEIPASKIGETF